MVNARDNDDRKFEAALHGVEIKEDGTTSVRGKSALRSFHDRMTASWKR